MPNFCDLSELRTLIPMKTYSLKVQMLMKKGIVFLVP